MDEIKAIKEIGEKVGYGNMMTIASALWRKSAKEKGSPITGVFIPTCLSFIKEDLQNLSKREMELFDRMVSDY